MTRWLAGDLELVISALLLAELARALAYPKLRAGIAADEAKALASSAAILVTGDQDLLGVKGLPVRSPRAFLATLERL